MMITDSFGKCPYATAQKVIQGKWTILIMYILSDGPIRFNELQRQLPKMTHATLAKQLKQLEADGLIIRTEYPQIPPKVEYSLSEIGRKFDLILDSFEVWGQQYIKYMENGK